MYPSEIFYTQFAQSYSHYSNQRQVYLSAVNNFVKQEVGSVETIVDVGSGDGKRGRLIARLLGASSLSFIDNSDGMVNLLKDIPNTQVIKDDISNDSFKSKNKYGLVLCLWNVLGHVAAGKRVSALKNLSSLVKDNGVIFIDVNNRYNVTHYGLRAVIKNVFKDIFVPGIHNGDFKLNIKINNEEIKTIVHIFNPYEIEQLFKLSGLKILKREVIDYKTGKIRNVFWCGQLVYKLAKV